MNPEQSDLHRPAKLGPHIVPGIWRHMLPPELRTLNFPRERFATCDHCPQVNGAGYRPDYRCCTYFPRVPNFLMGLALQNAQGAALVRRESMLPFFMPEGFQPSPQLWATFVTEAEEERFGKTDKVLCPFLEPSDGRCGIYAYRNSVCSTYFCEFEYGGQGRRFWDRLHTVAMQVEMALGQWCLRQVGFDVEAYLQRLDALSLELATASDDGRTWSKKARAFLWGDWLGREIELYIKCAVLVDSHKAELWEIAGQTDILDAKKFERAAGQLVPAAHQEQFNVLADEHDSADFATASASKLWLQVVKQHRKMWKVAKAKAAKGIFDDGL